MSESTNRRILLVDDTPSIHEDFRKILEKRDASADAALDGAMAGLLGAAAEAPPPRDAAIGSKFEIESAYQGEEAAALVKARRAEGRPFALAFVDIRMPPGWDGIRTIDEIWKHDTDVQTIVCTAYSDYTWEQMVQRLGRSDRLLVLKKPFDTVEVSQMALALTEKWNIARREADLIGKLTRAEAEARAYAASLETVNHALMTAKAATDMLTEMKSEFLLRLSDEVNHNVKHILGNAVALRKGDGAAAALQSIETIIGTSERLMLTFHETLDVAMLETGRDRFETTSVDPAASLRDLVREDRAGARWKGIEVAVEIAEEVPASVELHARRFRQVVEELLRNAVDHAEGPLLRLACRMDSTHDWQHPQLRIEIAGLGLDVIAAGRGTLFDLFARKPAGGAAASASGIGLALAKRIADAMGWELAVEAQPGGSAAFVLAMDAVGTPAPQAPA